MPLLLIILIGVVGYYIYPYFWTFFWVALPCCIGLLIFVEVRAKNARNEGRRSETTSEEESTDGLEDNVYPEDQSLTEFYSGENSNDSPWISAGLANIIGASLGALYLILYLTGNSSTLPEKVSTSNLESIQQANSIGSWETCDIAKCDCVSLKATKIESEKVKDANNVKKHYSNCINMFGGKGVPKCLYQKEQSEKQLEERVLFDTNDLNVQSRNAARLKGYDKCMQSSTKVKPVLIGIEYALRSNDFVGPRQSEPLVDDESISLPRENSKDNPRQAAMDYMLRNSTPEEIEAYIHRQEIMPRYERE